MLKTHLFLEQILIVTAIFSFVFSLICFCIGAIPNGFILLVIFVAILAIAKRFFPEGFTDTVLQEELEPYIYNEYTDYKFSEKSLNRSFNVNRDFWTSVSFLAKQYPTQPFKIHIHIVKDSTRGNYYEQISFTTYNSEQQQLLSRELKRFRPIPIQLDKNFVVA